MKTNGSNANQVATTQQKKGTLGEWLNERKDSLNQALPANTVNVDRFMQSAFLAITNPKMPNLRLCTKDSIFRALREAASYGLELNGTLGQAYLIPYNESRNVNGQWVKEMTCHFQMGFRGMIALARRSNTIRTIAAEWIHENDIVDIELGMNRHLSHKIDITKERGEIIACYCLVELVNGGVQFCIMTKQDIEKHRDKFSKAYNPKDPENIWVKNFPEMGLKTVVTKTLKLCPISIEALDAVTREEKEDLREPDLTVDYEVKDAEEVTPITETPTIETKVENQPEPEQPKNEPVQQITQNQPSFDEMNSFTPEEEAMAEAAFNSAPQNMMDIF